MNANLPPNFDLLLGRIERLTMLCRKLSDENRSLRHSQEQWMQERAQLLSKSDQARTRVDALIQRLKSMEQNP